MLKNNQLRFITTSLNEIVVGSIVDVTSHDQPSIDGKYRVADIEQDINSLLVTIATDIEEAMQDSDEGILTSINGSTNSDTSGYGNVVGRVTDKIVILNSTTPFVTVNVNEYVYFERESRTDKFYTLSGTTEQRKLWFNDTDSVLRKREPGRGGMNFLWHHRTPRTNLIDPATTNIHDMFVVTRSYY